MQDTSRYAVGLDIGTTNVRCVIGRLDDAGVDISIIGASEVPNSGMRRGIVADLNKVARSVDDALAHAERMSGYRAESMAISINGSHILSTTVDGMIAVGAESEVSHEDIHRLEGVATMGKVPANRYVLEFIPHSYSLDGQDGIKDPLGMSGSRLELSANVVSALMPHYTNIQKVAEINKTPLSVAVPSVTAASKAVLTEQQIENGVAVVDFGGATTGVAIYEEGDLQFTGVVPLGGMQVTNDLAIGLKVDPEVAEAVKREFASANITGEDKQIPFTHGDASYEFSLADIEEIVEARLEEIIEQVDALFKRSGLKGRLPNGVVIVGGASKLDGLDEYARTKLDLAVKRGVIRGFTGVTEQVEDPSFAAALGLVLEDAGPGGIESGVGYDAGDRSGGGSVGMLKKFFGRFSA